MGEDVAATVVVVLAISDFEEELFLFTETYFVAEQIELTSLATRLVRIEYSKKYFIAPYLTYHRYI